MVSKSEFWCGDPVWFPRRKGTNKLFNFFEGSNEKIMVREQKEKVLW